MKKITILGWFGQGNLGDDIILYNQIKILREYYHNPKITVFRGKHENHLGSIIPHINTIKLPPITWYRFYKFLNPFYLYEVVFLLKKTDLFVLGGGGFFSDRQFFAVGGWLRYARIASFFRASCIGFGMGVGPILYPYNQKLLSRTLPSIFHFILVRDTISYKYLKELTFPKEKICKIIDPAFFTQLIISEKNNSISFIIHNSQNIDFYISQMKQCKKLYNYQINILITDYLDINIAKKIQKILPSIEIIIPNDAITLVEEISKSDFIFSERLHGSIIAFTQKVPFLNIYYHHKGKELCNILDINDFSININNISSANLQTYIDKKHSFVFKDIGIDTFRELIYKKLGSLK